MYFFHMRLCVQISQELIQATHYILQAALSWAGRITRGSDDLVATMWTKSCKWQCGFFSGDDFRVQSGSVP